MRSASNLDRSSSKRRTTLSWLRSSAVSMSSWSVGSATTSQPNGLAISVVSADSNRVGVMPLPMLAPSQSAPPPRPSWPGPLVWPEPGDGSAGSAEAWRPGQGAQISRPRSLIRPSLKATPRAPQGKVSSLWRSPGGLP